jgi:hypothetical protein
MPVFECSRCNNLTYSAARFAAIACDVCAGERHRVLEQAYSFDDARGEPRELTHGDHCCAGFEIPDDVVPLLLHVIRTGLTENAHVIAYPQEQLRRALAERLTPDEEAAVNWGPSGDVYGPGFDADEVIGRFRGVAEASDRPVYVIGGSELPLHALADADEFRRYERLATEAAVELGMVVVCAYDRTLPHAEHVAAGEETHPLATSGGPVKRNERYVYAAV